MDVSVAKSLCFKLQLATKSASASCLERESKRAARGMIYSSAHILCLSN